MRTHLTSSSGKIQLEKLGVSRFDLADPYHLALTLSWPQFFAGLVAIYLGLNALFALLYVAVPGSIANARPGSLADAFFFSVETLATVGYGAMSPANTYGHIVSTLEILIGMGLTATMTGLVFVRFSKPKAKILFAEKVVVTTRHQRRTLMIRIGNGRINALTDASVRLTVLNLEVEPDGQRMRRSVDLPLVRSDLPYFALTWTLMHEIGIASPLADLDATNVLDDGGLRFFLSVTARDPSLGAQVFDLHAYQGSDIVFGMRYADAVAWDGANRSVADMGKLSALEPDNVPAAVKV